MPSRHSIKTYIPNTYYHIFNRGVGKRTIFKEQKDYIVFLNLLKRHLSLQPISDRQGREYPWYAKDIQLLAFCLMPNHFHLLVFQSDETAMTRLMRSICIAYTMYFNKKYKRVGHLFQDRFKAAIIDNDSYLQHISRYIHLNPESYQDYKWSSLPYYKAKMAAEWIKPDKILEIFDSREEYEIFLNDHKDHKQMLDEIKESLANHT